MQMEEMWRELCETIKQMNLKVMIIKYQFIFKGIEGQLVMGVSIILMEEEIGEQVQQGGVKLVPKILYYSIV